MPFKSQKHVMLAKVEVTYGVDPTPTGAANAILASNIKLTPMSQALQARNPIRPYFANDGQFVANQHVQLEFDVELAGGGAAGTAPGWGALMKGCAMSETVNASVSVVYAPISTAEQSVYFYFNIDGKQHKIAGARGTWSLKFSRGNVPLINFKFIGLYVLPTDTAMPTPTLTGFTKPVPVNNANTTPVTLHSFAGVFSEISLDIANTNVYRNLIGAENVSFVDRKPKGACTLEMPTLAGKDFYTIAAAGTVNPLALTHGLVAGNICAISCPKVQITNPTHSSADNIEMLGLTLDLQPNAGNDEITITLT